jgi:hypothetical protein
MSRAPQGQKIKAVSSYGTTEADAVIHCQGERYGSPCNEDVAAIRQPDGTYQLKADWYTGTVAKKLGAEFKRLTQLYGVHKATAEARRKGYTVSRQPGRNGAINLVITGRSL